MGRGVLIDAGPLIAILNGRDDHHARCVAALRELREPLLTTWMPITEAMYLLDFSSDAQGALLEMIDRRALEVLSLEPNDTKSVRLLMEKYRDLPMDFADATLVHVANREQIGKVFTVDRRDFSVYRLSDGRSLELIP